MTTITELISLPRGYKFESSLKVILNNFAEVSLITEHSLLFNLQCHFNATEEGPEEETTAATEATAAAPA